MMIKWSKLYETLDVYDVVDVVMVDYWGSVQMQLQWTLN